MKVTSLSRNYIISVIRNFLLKVDDIWCILNENIVMMKVDAKFIIVLFLSF